MNKFKGFKESDREIRDLGNMKCEVPDVQIEFRNDVAAKIYSQLLNEALDRHLVQRVIDEPKSSDKSVKMEDKYTLKKLPDGKVWMMENLREPVEGAKWSDIYDCYYYTWEQALKAVPEGFRLPAMSDFALLRDSLGYGKVSNEEVVKKLQGVCGFSPAGFYDFDDKKFCSQGSHANYWSSPAQCAANAYDLGFNTSGNVNPVAYTNKYYGRTVRCIKND